MKRLIQFLVKKVARALYPHSSIRRVFRGPLKGKKFQVAPVRNLLLQRPADIRRDLDYDLPNPVCSDSPKFPAMARLYFVFTLLTSRSHRWASDQSLQEICIQ